MAQTIAQDLPQDLPQDSPQDFETYDLDFTSDSARTVLGLTLANTAMEAAPGLSFKQAGDIADRALEVMQGFGLGALQGFAQAEEQAEAQAEEQAAPAAADPMEEFARYDLVQHLRRQRAFSAMAFGPGDRTEGICRHIERELHDVRRAAKNVAALPHGSVSRRAAQQDLIEEWVDVILLGLDGAWRADVSPQEIARALEAKLAKNEARDWPDWRTMSPDEPIEHNRSGEAEAGGAPESAAESGKAAAMSLLEGLADPDRWVELTWSKKKHDLSPTLPAVLAELVDERHRQIEVKGWSPERDDLFHSGGLARAAAAYAASAAATTGGQTFVGRPGLPLWPWPDSDFKPRNPRRDLIRAGALIVAEIERLDRAAARAEV